MPRYRDVGAFHDRSAGYELGWRGRMHHDIALRTADLALSIDGTPRRVLDVGCGTGLLLRLLAQRLPIGTELVGVDAAPGMIDVAKSVANDSRLVFSIGTAENLPLPASSFDLVVTTTSFDHWEDQRRGVVECARVLRPGGHLIVVDLFSLWLIPTLLFGRSGRVRTRGRARTLMSESGFQTVTSQRLYATIIGAAVASK